MKTAVEELRDELARVRAEGRELKAKLAIAEGERDAARALGAAWAEAADVVTPSDHTPEALRRRGESLVAQANAQARTLGEVAALRAERDAALAQTEQLTRGLREAQERARTADKVADACAAEAKALRDIVEGWTIPPTDAELAAHEAAGGRWRCTNQDRQRMDAARARIAREVDDALGHVTRWWAHDRDGRPCARPVATEAPRG